MSSVSHAFPEHRYLPVPHLRPAYDELKRIGGERARHGRAVICGMARDVAERLPRVLPAVESVAGLFHEHRIIVYENDSTDATPEALASWCCEDKRRRTLISEALGKPKFGSIRSGERGNQNCGYRERCRTMAGELAPNFEYVIVLDLDLHRFSLDGIRHSLGHNDWDMIGSNGLNIQHGRVVQNDVWAWREHTWAPRTLQEIHPHVYQRGLPMIRLLSCFGGLGLYRMPAYLAGEYIPEGDIEHVSLHKSMARAGFGRIFLNPSQIVLYECIPD